jgi:CubicO group peptidase (beta-lactamase class C family)
LLVAFLISPLLSTQKTEAVDKLFSKWDRPDSPGAAIAIIQEGRIIYERGYGMANLEHAVPITGDTVFRIGSTSKQFTAACVAILALDGKLDLDADIRKYLPEMPEYEKPITVRHLLHHTSGVRDYLVLHELAGTSDFGFYTPEESLELVAHQQNLNFLPGEEHLYSNSGYLLLGFIVKRVSGKSLNEFAQEHIFKPLGMKATLFLDDHTRIVKNRADGHSPSRGDFRIDNTSLDHVGDGGVFTTVEDLFLWDQAFYNFKLGKELMDLIQTTGRLNNGEEMTYAFGLDVDEYRGLRRVSHGGAFVGFRADMVRFPEQRFSVICLSNLSTFNPSKLCMDIANIYLESEFAPLEKAEERTETAAISLPLAELEEKTGNYKEEKTGDWYILTIGEGKLSVYWGGRRFLFVPVSPTHFVGEDPPVPIEIEFMPDEEGKLNKAKLKVSGKERVLSKSHPVAPLSPSQMQQYVGDYYSEEISTAYRLEVMDGKLYFAHKYALRGNFRLMAPDQFTVRWLKLDFIRDAQRQIQGFLLGAGRVKNMKFKKK